MRVNLRYLCGIICVMVVMCSCHSPSTKQGFTVNNRSALNRKDELIVLDKKELNVFADAPFVKVSDSAHHQLDVQYDDLDHDGQWDQLVFLDSFLPNEQKSYGLEPAGEAKIKGRSFAHVRHRRKISDQGFGPSLESDSVPGSQPATDFTKTPLPPFLTEGPAWENDRVGFRIYFDERNGKDIWGKIVPDMVMDTLGTLSQDNYHALNYWGMDILKVGASLGAGSLAIRLPGTDSLIRLGGAAVRQVRYERIADGPLRALFRLQYQDWTIPGIPNPIQVTEEISIRKGQYAYESIVSISGAPAGARVVTGIVNLRSKKMNTIDVPGVQNVYSYDRQSENNDWLGMAVLSTTCDSCIVGQTDKAGSVRDTYTMSSEIGEAPFRFCFYACWEKSDPRFTSESGFVSFLTDEANRLASPLKISWK